MGQPFIVYNCHQHLQLGHFAELNLRQQIYRTKAVHPNSLSIYRLAHNKIQTGYAKQTYISGLSKYAVKEEKIIKRCNINSLQNMFAISQPILLAFRSILAKGSVNSNCECIFFLYTCLKSPRQSEQTTHVATLQRNTTQVILLTGELCFKKLITFIWGFYCQYFDILSPWHRKQ